MWITYKKVIQTSSGRKVLSFLLVFCLLQWVVDKVEQIVNKFVEISESKEHIRNGEI